MKHVNNLLGIMLLVIITAICFLSCKKNDLSGEPVISYVRTNDPAKADSTFTSAYQGKLIVLVGKNLGEAVEVWFNDQKALLTSSYITDQTILVRVPLDAPKEVTDKIRLVFRGGKILEYNFHVEIDAPKLNSMLCEYVSAGNIATIRGEYFFEPLKVTFQGGAEGEIVSVDKQLLKVRVPATAGEGPINVKTNFGETTSGFWFRDSRNIFLGSDPFKGWWGASFVVTSPGPEDPPKINGNYIRVKQNVSGWLTVAGGAASAMGELSRAVPNEAIETPENYNLKFEVATLKPYTANRFNINVGLRNSYDNNNYGWSPPYDTKRDWETIVIPFEEVVQSYRDAGADVVVDPNGYNIRLHFLGPGALDCDMAFDNFRVVPK